MVGGQDEEWYDHHNNDDASQEFLSSLYLFCYSVLPSWIIGFKVMLAAKNTFYLFQWKQRQVIFATTHNYYFEPISSYFWKVHSKNGFPNWLEICVRQVVRAAGKAHPSDNGKPGESGQVIRPEAAMGRVVAGPWVVAWVVGDAQYLSAVLQRLRWEALCCWKGVGGGQCQAAAQKFSCLPWLPSTLPSASSCPSSNTTLSLLQCQGFKNWLLGQQMILIFWGFLLYRSDEILKWRNSYILWRTMSTF